MDHDDVDVLAWDEMLTDPETAAGLRVRYTTAAAVKLPNRPRRVGRVQNRVARQRDGTTPMSLYCASMSGCFAGLGVLGYIFRHQRFRPDEPSFADAFADEFDRAAKLLGDLTACATYVDAFGQPVGVT